MNAFILTCACGQTMTVPDSAVGRNGLCPACGAEIAITRDRLSAPSEPKKRGGGLLARRNAIQVAQNNDNREEAWRKFAVAVDLYNNKRYAEALTLLSALQQTFPGNPSIDAAQEQCAEALKEASSPTLQYEGERVSEETLSEELIKGVILKKMLHGATEEIQLRAAELGARVIGLLDPTPPAPAPFILSPISAAPPRPDFAHAGGNGSSNGESVPVPSPAPAKPSRRKRTVEEIP